MLLFSFGCHTDMLPFCGYFLTLSVIVASVDFCQLSDNHNIPSGINKVKMRRGCSSLVVRKTVLQLVDSGLSSCVCTPSSLLSCPWALCRVCTGSRVTVADLALWLSHGVYLSNQSLGMWAWGVWRQGNYMDLSQGRSGLVKNITLTLPYPVLTSLLLVKPLEAVVTTHCYGADFYFLLGTAKW